MPTRDAIPAGAPCWIELSTSDVERSRSFYGTLLGWTAEAPSEEFGGYFMFQRAGVPVAGGMPSAPEQEVRDVWSVYLRVDDAAKTCEAAEAHGGTVVVPPMDVADLGTMAVLVDAGGAAVGLWQPKEFAGLSVVGEPGAPAWFELHTRDYERAVAFYRDVLGWQTRTEGDTPEFRYTVQEDAGEQYAGVMDASGFLPEGVPAHWSVYFAVDDTDATLAAVAREGGQVIVPAEDTPYGRLATATDPNGARFRLVAGGPAAAT